MAGTTADNLGLVYDWILGENYKTDMDANLLLLDRMVNLSVIDRDLSAPPGSPTAGDRYIVAASGSGAWLAHDDDVAVWTGASWAFYTPKTGWLAYIEDENVLSVWNGSNWSAGAAMGA